MIAAALLLAQPAPLPPADWSTLPELPVAAPGARFDPSAFVRREVAADRCRAVLVNGRTMQVDAPVAVLLNADGTARRIVPQAIGCPMVEQYTAGYVSTLVRRAGAAVAELRPGWYRYVVTYRWSG